MIHNAGVYNKDPQRILQVNVLAPYVLTALMDKPKRLVYVSSSMHQNARLALAQLDQGCSDTAFKKYLLLLTKALARKFSTLAVNA